MPKIFEFRIKKDFDGTKFNHLAGSFLSPEISSTLSPREHRSAQFSEALSLLLNIL